MSQEQLKTFTLISRFIDKSISRQQAAELLDLSALRLHAKKGVLTSCTESLIHKNTGRKPGQLIQVDSTPYEWFGGK